MQHITFSFIFLIVFLGLGAFPTRRLLQLRGTQPEQVKPDVPWINDAVFVLQPSLSDEFSGSQLDSTKWDEHALRNPDTGCPHWNGPIYSTHPGDSTLYPSTTDPETGKSSVRFHDLEDGKLRLRVEKKPISFFEQREYYCDNTTFTCNHNSNISCFLTDVWGKPLLEGGKYVGVLHDKCKQEPYCIPHHLHVTGVQNRSYSRIASTHISSKTTLKYGFIESRVQLPNTSAVAALWLHNDDMTNGWCRVRYTKEGAYPMLECPSITRSRRWQEIDIFEAMNVGEQAYEFYPNIHAFAMYKGEFSSAHAVSDDSGGMGGGPIIISSIFDENNPSFADIPKEKRVDNDWHWEPGPIATLNQSWAETSHTVGLYWSPNEIRFYLDGKEVGRIRNILIHQPMFIDISYGLNTPWTKVSPTDEDINQSVTRIDYIRTWKVLTEDGKEPSHSIKLRQDMVTGFDNRYGNQLNGVFNRFPTNDSFELRPVVRNVHTNGNSSHSMNENVIMDIISDSKDYFEKEPEYYPENINSKYANFKPAGGSGNNRYIERRGTLSRKQRELLLTRSDRVSKVRWSGGHRYFERIGHAGRTVFDTNDPNENLAGWAMERNRSRRHNNSR